MQLGVDVMCMHTNFGGHDPSSFGDMATFQKQPKVCIILFFVFCIILYFLSLVYKVIPHDAGPDYEPVLIGGHLLDPQPSSPTPPPGVREEPVIMTGPPPAGPPPVAPPVVPPAGPPLVVPPVASSGASIQTNQVIN